MTSSRRCFWLALCASAFLHVPASSAQSPGAGAAPRQAPIVLGTDGADYSRATAINNHRQVVGSLLFGTGGLSRPFLWEDGVMRALPTLGPTGYGTAVDINDRGQIVGVTIDAAGMAVATLWQDRRPMALARLPTAFGCTPTAISERGLIAGYCVIPRDLNYEVVTVLLRDGVPIQLMIPPGIQAFPRDVNDFGVVVGTALRAGGTAFEFVWHEGVLTDVGQLTGRRFEFVAGVNRRGEIAGYGLAGISFEALFWNGSTLAVLEGLPGTTSATVADLNDHGDVVGQSGVRPVLWTKGSALELPAASLGSASIPVAINNWGDVIGNALVGPSDSLSVAILWPGPTPATELGGGR